MDCQDTKKALPCPGGRKIRTRTRKPRYGCPCTGNGDFVHVRPILDVPYTVEPVFVHGRLNRRYSGGRRPTGPAGPHRRFCGGAPSPREGVWGWGNVGKRSCLSAQSRKPALTAGFQSFVDYHTDLSNFYRFYRLLLGGVDYFTKKGIVITLYEVKYGFIRTHQLKDTRKGKK